MDSSRRRSNAGPERLAASDKGEFAMTGIGSDAFAALPLPLVRRVEKICNRFEAAWKAGRRPQVKDFANDVPEPARPVLVRELIRLDVDYRRLDGEEPGPREYLA